jgi:hypothetical protein
MGEPIPDKNDPRYKERYERDVKAGQNFADKTGISYLAAHVQVYANKHKVGFLIVVFGFVFLCFITNLIGMVTVYKQSTHQTATSIQDSVMRHQRMMNHVGQQGRTIDYQYQ